MTVLRVVVPVLPHVAGEADAAEIPSYPRAVEADTAVEQLVARLLELAPAGFEERTVLAGGTADARRRVEFVVYGTEEELRRVVAEFPHAYKEQVAPGWEDAWRAFHLGVEVGGLWVGPPWETAPAGLQAVVIDPGRAFGTGAHPTTRHCIELLARTPRGSLLDIGCGSGVLAIAAVRLGFEPVIAVDDDPVAVEVTRANVAANGVELEANVADALRDVLPDVDVAVANVLLEPVTAILSRVRANHVVTSGYLESEQPPAPGWRHLDRVEGDGWAADLFARS